MHTKRVYHKINEWVTVFISTVKANTQWLCSSLDTMDQVLLEIRPFWVLNSENICPQDHDRGDSVRQPTASSTTALVKTTVTPEGKIL